MIFVDYREERSGSLKYFAEYKLEYELKNLFIGDYIVDQKIVVERKTTNDFVNSIKTGRLYRQIAKLNKYRGKKLIIIEGIGFQLMRGINPSAVTGTLVSIAATWQIPILFSDGLKQTVSILSIIHRQVSRWGKTHNKKVYRKKKQPSIAQNKKILLESLPLVGPKLADELLKEFGSLEEIFKATAEDLTIINGIGKKKASRIKDVLREEKGRYTIS